MNQQPQTSAPKAFVIGHPISHSRSPLIHGYWLKQYGLQGRYEALDVTPDALETFLKTFLEQGYSGGNVTLPLKEKAFEIVRDFGRITETAEAIGAVNTLYYNQGVLIGDNTDALGFIGNLDSALGAEWDASAKTALVLGAGGAARAVIAGLLSRRVETIVIANRTQSRADALRSMSQARIRTVDWREAHAEAIRADLIVNTTSLGMAGQPPLDLRLNGALKTAVAADIVYVPLLTPLLREAEMHNLRRVDGLGMLLHQAVPGFSRWFGVTPQVTDGLRRLIEIDLLAKAAHK